VIQVLALLGIVGLASSSSVYDESLKGEQLLALCSGEASKVVECDRYIEGARDGMAAQRLFMGLMLRRAHAEPGETVMKLLTNEPFCNIPDNVSPSELRNTVTAFMNKDGANSLKSSAAFAVVMALTVKYSCGAK
jgi:hypothetical protein